MASGLAINPLLVPVKSIFMRPADFMNRPNERLTVIFLQIEPASLGPQQGWADFNRLAVHDGEKPCVEGPMMPLAQTQAVSGIVRP